MIALGNEVSCLKLEMAFGVVLRRYRKEISLSQEQLAHNANLDRTYISLLERGLRKPTITTVFVLAVALNIHPNDLVKEAAQLQTEFKFK
jgi:transcriptional regulator with XRE-family HTH domain